MGVQVDQTGQQNPVRVVEDTVRGDGCSIGNVSMVDCDDAPGADGNISRAIDPGTGANDASGTDHQVEMRGGWLHCLVSGEVSYRQGKGENSKRGTLPVVSRSITLAGSVPVSWRRVAEIGVQWFELRCESGLAPPRCTGTILLGQPSCYWRGVRL